MATCPEVAEFERDTAVAPAGEGVWSATVSPDWGVPRGPNGGYIAAIVLRAMEAEVADPARAPRSLTLHYLRPPATGPAEVHVTTERAGRTVTSLSARLVQDGVTSVLALAAFAGDFPAAAGWTTPMPGVAPPGGLRVAPEDPKLPAISRRVALEHLFGPKVFSSGQEAEVGGWTRLAERREIDYAALALFADVWLPAAFTRMDAFAPAPTIDLTIHFRARLPHPGLTADDP